MKKRRSGAFRTRNSTKSAQVVALTKKKLNSQNGSSTLIACGRMLVTAAKEMRMANLLTAAHLRAKHKKSARLLRMITTNANLAIRAKALLLSMTLKAVTTLS